MQPRQRAAMLICQAGASSPRCRALVAAMTSLRTRGSRQTTLEPRVQPASQRQTLPQINQQIKARLEARARNLVTRELIHCSRLAQSTREEMTRRLIQARKLKALKANPNPMTSLPILGSLRLH